MAKVHSKRIRILFDTIDYDSDGLIFRQELSAAMRKFDPSWDEDQLPPCVVEGTGLRVEEFEQWFQVRLSELGGDSIDPALAVCEVGMNLRNPFVRYFYTGDVIFCGPGHDRGDALQAILFVVLPDEGPNHYRMEIPAQSSTFRLTFEDTHSKDLGQSSLDYSIDASLNDGQVTKWNGRIDADSGLLSVTGLLDEKAETWISCKFSPPPPITLDSLLMQSARKTSEVVAPGTADCSEVVLQGWAQPKGQAPVPTSLCSLRRVPYGFAMGKLTIKWHGEDSWPETVQVSEGMNDLIFVGLDDTFREEGAWCSLCNKDMGVITTMCPDLREKDARMPITLSIDGREVVATAWGQEINMS